MNKVFNTALTLLFPVALLVLIVGSGINIYKATISTGSIESFEVERGANSLTCVTAWVGTQATMSCLPTQWMEAEVVYDQGDFQGSTDPELVPANEYEYPVCGDGVPPQDSCWTKDGQLFPGYVVQ